MPNDEIYPGHEEFDPFARADANEDMIPMGDGPDVFEAPPAPDEAEIAGLLRKVCLDCSVPGELPVLMDVQESTMRDITGDQDHDDEFVRTWAVCPKCRQTILVQ
jgi:hypothetical protein